MERVKGWWREQQALFSMAGQGPARVGGRSRGDVHSGPYPLVSASGASAWR